MIRIQERKKPMADETVCHGLIFMIAVPVSDTLW